MRKSVSTPTGEPWSRQTLSLYASNGVRKYLNREERKRALSAMTQLDISHRLFALVLTWTGARISEVLALTPASFQIESNIVTIVTLKRRRLSIREVPIPPRLMALLNVAFGLRALQKDQRLAQQHVWRFCRMTAWRIIKRVMLAADIMGAHACPKGLRHAFAICALHASVPVTLVQRWMGHARLSTTAIYLDVCGPDEISFAQRFWRSAA